MEKLEIMRQALETLCSDSASLKLETFSHRTGYNPLDLIGLLAITQEMASHFTIALEQVIEAKRYPNN